MEIGISTGLFYKRNVVDLLPLIKKTGFDVVEVWDGGQEWGSDTHFDHRNVQQVKLLQDALWNNQIRALTIHGPFGNNCDLSVSDSVIREKALSEMNTTIQTAVKIGAGVVIVHPGNLLTNALDSQEKNIRLENSIKSLKKLAKIAKEKNVKLAVENMLGGMVGGEQWQLDKILAGLEEEVVGMCLDVSHASLTKELDKYLKVFNKRIFAVHISDNHGSMDDHLIPGEGIIDFVKIVKKLNEILFQGVFTLEILGENVNRTPEDVLKTTKTVALKILKQAGL